MCTLYVCVCSMYLMYDSFTRMCTSFQQQQHCTGLSLSLFALCNIIIGNPSSHSRLMYGLPWGLLASLSLSPSLTYLRIIKHRYIYEYDDSVAMHEVAGRRAGRERVCVGVRGEKGSLSLSEEREEKRVSHKRHTHSHSLENEERERKDNGCTYTRRRSCIVYG